MQRKEKEAKVPCLFLDEMGAAYACGCVSLSPCRSTPCRRDVSLSLFTLGHQEECVVGHRALRRQ
jgi:hypothetical protein